VEINSNQLRPAAKKTLRPNSIVAIITEATGIFFLRKTVDMHSTECGRKVQYFGVFFINKKDA